MAVPHRARDRSLPALHVMWIDASASGCVSTRPEPVILARVFVLFRHLPSALLRSRQLLLDLLQRLVHPTAQPRQRGGRVGCSRAFSARLSARQRKSFLLFRSVHDPSGTAPRHRSQPSPTENRNRCIENFAASERLLRAPNSPERPIFNKVKRQACVGAARTP